MTNRISTSKSIQDIAKKTDTAVTVQPEGQDHSFDATLPSPILPNALVAINDNGTGFVFYDSAQLGNESSNCGTSPSIDQIKDMIKNSHVATSAENMSVSWNDLKNPGLNPKLLNGQAHANGPGENELYFLINFRYESSTPGSGSVTQVAFPRPPGKKIYKRVWWESADNWNSWGSCLPEWKVWASSHMPIVKDTLVTVNHGLAIDPAKCLCDVRLQCIVAEGNYSVGEYINGFSIDYGEWGDPPAVASLNATSVSQTVGPNGTGFLSTYKDSGQEFNPSTTKWRMVFRVFYIG